jgi:hypothetical protein
VKPKALIKKPVPSLERLGAGSVIIYFDNVRLLRQVKMVRAKMDKRDKNC